MNSSSVTSSITYVLGLSGLCFREKNTTSQRYNATPNVLLQYLPVKRNIFESSSSRKIPVQQLVLLLLLFVYHLLLIILLY